MKNRIFALLLALSLLFASSACTEKESTTDAESTSKIGSSDESSPSNSSGTTSVPEQNKVSFTPNTTVKRYFEDIDYYDETYSETIRYLLHEPIRKTGEDYPLFIFLHGLYETVNTDSLGTALQPVEALMSLENLNEKYSAYVLVPKTPLPEEGWWQENQIEALKALIIRTMVDYDIDIKRVYLSGISMGGYTICRLVNEMPKNTFAAVVTFSAASNLYNPTDHFNTGFRIYHAEKDETISPGCSVSLGEQLKAAGHKNAEYTVFEGGDHLSPLKSVFRDDRYDFFDWLFAQKLP